MTRRRAEVPDSQRRVERVLRASRVAMALERGLRAFWPFMSAVAAIWSGLAFGLAEGLTRGQARLGLALGLGLLLLLLWRGVRRFRWPSRAAAIQRLDDTLPGRPLAALEDAPALGRDDPAVGALWAVHRARMMQRAERAERVKADLRLARQDPWAIRLCVLVFFIAALVFTRMAGFESVTTAFGPAASADPEAGPSYEGWAEPPIYTGRPTLYLPDLAGHGPVSLPKATRITLRAYGDPEQFALDESVSGRPAAADSLAAAAEGIAIAEFAIARSGEITLNRGGEEMGSWAVRIEPDSPPEIALAQAVERAPGGAMRLAYTAKDDHGVTAARAEIRLDLPAVDRRYGLTPAPEERPALVVQLPLPMTGAAQEVSETLVEDLSKHPWAGLPVTISLVAEDALGQTGRAEPARAVLPGRKFYDPTAAALVEQRRDLLWSVANATRVSQVLRAVSWRPEGLFDRPGAYLITRTVIRRLEAAIDATRVPAARGELAEALWMAALLLEEGSLGDAAERLAKAKERLQEALRGDASDEEIAELMQELRDATRDYMEQLAREALERGDRETAEAPPDGQTINQDQLQALMDRIQELSEQGRRAEAEALLEMLQQLLENMEMRFAQGNQGQGGPSQQSMQGLADALREQQDLADDSFQQLQREFREGQSGGSGDGGQPGQGGAQPGQMPGQAQTPGALADRQEALRQLLEELERNLPGEAGEGTHQSLKDAERNMDSAREGLENGDTAGALDRQAEAIDNLRDGMRNLSDDMRQAENGQSLQESPDGTAQPRNPTDPLGRPLGSMGGTRTDRQMLPEGGDAAARARQILEEIRRRSGDLSRPEVELDYLRRLLDRF